MITSAPFHGLYKPSSAGGGALNPDQISDLAMWLDATVLGLSDGAAVTTWTDASGNGRHGTGVNSPTFETNEINGLSVIRFVAASQQHFTLPNFMTGFTQAEVFVIIKAVSDSPAANRSLWHFGAAITQSIYPSTAGNIIETVGSSTSMAVNPTPALTAWRLYNADVTSSNRTQRLDGSVINTFATGGGSTWPSAPRIASRGGSSFFFDGDMAEIVLYSRALNSTERDGIEAYFAAKYGLAIA